MRDPMQMILDFVWPEPEPAVIPERPQLPVEKPSKQANEPIPYSVKVSARAKQVYLRAVPGKGLIVTIPKRFPKRDIPEVIETHRSWVEQALSELEEQIPEEFRQWPPRSLPLRACGTVVTIEYRTPKGDSTKVKWLDDTTLIIDADENDRVAVASCIAAALKLRARQVLGPWLARLAKDHGFTYKRLVVRGQRSVWGSYSSSGTLSLNYKLLFLSQQQVDYVLLHELTHTRHLDHSAAFWNLLDEQISGAREIDKQLNSAGRLVPPWLEQAN